MRQIKSIIIHHSQTEKDTVDSIRKYHVNHNKWDDIGYHYVIEQSGDIKEGRPILTQGAHCKGQNKHSIGICLVGMDKFSEAQFQSLHRLLDLLISTHKICKKNIFGHNEFSTKKCPSFDVGLIRELL